jgi:iron complex outermembrane receptor protein
LSQIQFSKGDIWRLQLFQHKQQWQTNIERLSEQAVSRRNVTDYASHTVGALATYAIDQTLFGVEWNIRQNIKIVEQEFNANNQFLWSNTSVDASETNIGLYVNQQWLFQQWVINAGARYDHLSVKQKQSSTVSKNAFSASLNTQYSVSDSTKYIAEIASSFRFPTVSELLFSGETPRGNTQGNAALLSEKSMGYQLSLTHQFSPKIEGRINTYQYDIENYIERITLANTASDIKSYINSDNATIKGVELMATWQASSQFNSSIGLQWQQGKNDQNKTVDDGLPTAIKWLWQWSEQLSHIKWLKAFNSLSITNNMAYRFQRNDVGPSEVKLPQALIWNSALTLKLNQEFELALSVFNVMNENYKASADENAPFQPKRSLNLDLTWYY